MKALARLESFIQELVERPAWLLTHRRLHPIEIAAALTRALESDALPLADRVLAPDSYAIQLHPGDYAQFMSVRQTLEREYAGYLTRLAQERGLTMNAPVSTSIVESRAVRAGAVAVATRFSEEASPAMTTPGRRVPRAPGVTETVAAPPPRPVATGVASLEVLGQDGAVLRRQPLGGDGLAIGRRSSSGLMLPDPEVSREHARIDYIPPRYFVRDLQSMNGTVVNGRRIDQPHPLTDGDLIEVGHSRLRFRVGG